MNSFKALMQFLRRPTIIAGIVGSVCAAGGCAYGQISTAKRLEKVMNEELQTVAVQLSKQYTIRVSQEMSRLNEELKQVLTAQTEEEKNPEEEKAKSFSPRVSYHKMHVEVEEEEEVAEEEITVTFTPNPEAFNPEEDANGWVPTKYISRPYVIPEEDWMDLPPSVEKTTATYYTADRVLLDDQDNEIEDIEYMIGTECLEHFGYFTDDPNIVFVFNPAIDVAFEVERVNGSYGSLNHSFEFDDDGRIRRFKGRFDD